MAQQKHHALRNKKIVLLGWLAYGITLLATAILVVVDPIGLNAKSALIVVSIALALSGSLPAYVIASNSPNRALVYTGTVALTLLFTLAGVWIVAGMGYLTALQHV